MLTSCSLVSCLPFLAVFLPTLSPSFFYSGLDRRGCQPPTSSNIENWYDQGFRYFAWSQSHKIQVNPRNPAKFTKTCKIPRNRSNRCLYNIFETYLSYLGYLLAVNLQIYLETSSLKRANNVLKLPGVDYVVKNWALAMMLKALPLVHFWSVLLLKEQMITSVRKMLKSLVWAAQNRSISSKICLENNHKIRRFLLIAFPAKLAAFYANLSLKILRNLTLFSATYQKPCMSHDIICAKNGKKKNFWNCNIWTDWFTSHQSLYCL